MISNRNWPRLRWCFGVLLVAVLILLARRGIVREPITANASTRPTLSVLYGMCSEMEIGPVSEQVFAPVNGLGSLSTNSNPWNCNNWESGTLELTGVVMPSNGSLSHLTVRAFGTTGVQFAVFINGTQTALTCTTSGTPGECADNKDIISVKQFDDVQAVLIIPAGKTVSLGAVNASLEKQ